jgi:Uma2 family endonuclease
MRIPHPTDAYRGRRPEISFVSFARWPAGRPMSLTAEAWDVVPDLAVQVISPKDLAGELVCKIAEYFQAGVRLVWVVYPTHRLVYVYERSNQVRVLMKSDTLDGGHVLPGFRLPLDRLFESIGAVAGGET